jgi:hypothetical protein
MTPINTADACCSSCATADNTALAIACALDSTGFKDRVSRIPGLAVANFEGTCSCLLSRRTLAPG